MSRYPNTEHNHDVLTANKSFGNVKFRHLRTVVRNQNRIHEEIKRRLNSGNFYYCSVPNFVSSRLLFENLKVIIYKKNNFTFCFAWS